MFEYTFREKLWNWTLRYPLWYLGALMANLITLVLVFPYRLFNEYILRRKVDLGGIAFVLYQFTEHQYRTQPLYYPSDDIYKPKRYPLGSYDLASLYPTLIKNPKGKEDGDI